MHYLESTEWVLGLTDYEKTGYSASAASWDLRRMEKLMEGLGNPHRRARTIHIAGTKGKGSISALIASALISCGYNTGLYTSPHLHTIRERIRLNNALISREDFALLAQKVRPIVEEINSEGRYGQITTYEALTALAFLYFQTRRADFQVIEVGLGGRLDATNVVEAEVSVVGSISFDHTEFLGNTLDEIAREKGGIIKKGARVVLSPQSFQDEGSSGIAEEVIARICQEKGASLIQVRNEFTWRKLGEDIQGQYLIIKSKRGDYKIFLPLLGTHQRENAATALAALEQLSSEKPLDQDCIARGFAQVSWPGRLQALKESPLLMVDGAHNGDSAWRLRESLEESFSNYRTAYLIFGSSKDKDIGGMARALSPLFPNVLLVRSGHPRSAPLAYLQELFCQAGVEAATAMSVGQAIDEALLSTEGKDLILVTGSLFVVAEAIEFLEKVPPGWDY